MRIDYQPIPERYFEEASKPGAIRKIEYHSVRGVDKHAFVYIPSGYDDANPDIRYDILYLMHGAGCSAATYFGSNATPNRYKNVLDNMIAAREMRPLLLVAPSFYLASVTNLSIENTGPLTEFFPEEHANELIPAVENTSHSYAASTGHAGPKASRLHRSFGGFSMGGVTTWYVFALSGLFFRLSARERRLLGNRSDGRWAVPEGQPHSCDAAAVYLYDVLKMMYPCITLRSSR